METKYQFIYKIENLKKENSILKESIAYMYQKYGNLEIYTKDESVRLSLIKEIKGIKID